MPFERWSVRLVREDMSAMSNLYSKVRDPNAAANIAHYILKDEAVEVVICLALNNRHAVIGWHEVSRGIVDASLVHPREVFKPVLLANASAIILAHNHPSGDPTPSQEDEMITDNLTKAAEILGIRFLDHLVIGTNEWRSIKEPVTSGTFLNQ